VRHDVEEAALPASANPGHALDRSREEGSVADDAQSSGTLCYEHVPAGKERNRPGILEAVSDRDDPIVVQG
jgi:hypothetical protein